MTQVESTEAFAVLDGHQYANLTTFRKSGVGVVTPVWFAEENGKIYVTTTPTAGKTKRIRNNSTVQLAPCTSSGKPLGATVEAVARILPPEEHAVAKRALDRKYGIPKAVFDFFMTLRGTERAYFEITPA